MRKLEVPKTYCRKKPGDVVVLYFRQGKEQLGEVMYSLTFRIVEFYPFIILCMDEHGFRRCFTYWEFQHRLDKVETMKMK